jgi:hypothetical protein
LVLGQKSKPNSTVIQGRRKVFVAGFMHLPLIDGDGFGRIEFRTANSPAAPINRTLEKEVRQ